MKLTPAEIKGLSDRFGPFGTDESVVAPLETLPKLLELVYEASDQLSSFFPHDEQKLLRLEDPGSKEMTLGLLVHSSLPTVETEQRLDDFDRQWWAENMMRSEGHLMVFGYANVVQLDPATQ